MRGTGTRSTKRGSVPPPARLQRTAKKDVVRVPTCMQEAAAAAEAQVAAGKVVMEAEERG
jgi:hypothetical protein